MLSKKKIDKRLEEFIRKLYEQGRIPNAKEVLEQLSKFREDNPELPLFKPPTFQPNTKFALDSFNQAMEEIDFDLTSSYEDIVDSVSDLIKQMHMQDAETQIHKAQIKRTHDQIGELLLVNSTSIGALASVYDTFNDVSKIDQENTTATIDLDLGAVTLREKANGTKRLHIGTTPQLPQIITTAEVIKEEQLSKERKSILTDVDQVWSYRVFTDSEDTQVQCILPIELSSGGLEPEFSRIDINPHVWGEIGIKVQYTRDFRNWLNLHNYNDFITTSGDKISMRFPTTKAKAIRIVMLKQSSSGSDRFGEEAAPRPYYHFGIANLSLFTTGYSSESVLYSKSLYPDYDIESIDKVSLYVEEDLPQGTDIKYDLGFAPTSTDDIQWTGLAPINRSIEGIPNVLDLKEAATSQPYLNEITITGELTGTLEVDGLDYYSLASYPNLSGVVPNTSKLWRGVNSWRKIKNNAIPGPIHEVVGCRLDFDSNTNKQLLYKMEYGAEPISIETGEYNAGSYSTDTKLRMDYPILRYDDNKTPITPIATLTGDFPTLTDFTIQELAGLSNQYSVEAVYHMMPVARGDTPIDMRTGAGIKKAVKRIASGEGFFVLGLPEDLHFIKSANIFLRYEVWAGTGLAGDQFEVINQWVNIKHLKTLDSADDGTDPEGYGINGAISYFKIMDSLDMWPSARSAASKNTASCSYAFGTLDITAAVTGINENYIHILKEYTDLTPQSRIAVNYRRTLQYDELEVLSDGLKASALKSPQQEGNLATMESKQAGVDFDLLSKRGVIQRKSNTDTTEAWSVDFNYRIKGEYRDVYTTFLNNKDPIYNLKLYYGDQMLTMDQSIGQKFFLRTHQGEVDLSNGQAEYIPPGLVQAVVYSDDYYTVEGKPNITSALSKILNTIDSEGYSLFTPNNKYWKSQRAFREPMQEVTFQRLTRDSYRGQRDVFSIADAQVWLNYEPYTESLRTLEFVTITGDPPAMSGNPTIYESGSAPVLSGVNKSIFQLEYRSKSDTIWSETITGVYLKATLKRAANTNGDITPVLGSYSLRFL